MPLLHHEPTAFNLLYLLLISAPLLAGWAVRRLHTLRGALSNLWSSLRRWRQLPIFRRGLPSPRYEPEGR